MLKKLFFVIFTFSFLCNLNARIWTAKNGKTCEGEVYKCTKISLTILTSQKKRITVKISDLSDEDITYLAETYPEFELKSKLQNKEIKEEKESPADNKDLIDENDVENTWPVIKTSKDSIGFRWDTSRGKFYTRHYHFNMRKKISEEDAIDLAIRCESAYEAVRQAPFIPDTLKRKSAAISKSDPHKKFVIEITNIKASKIAGQYSYTFSKSGNLISEKVEVEPKFLQKSSDIKKRGFDENVYFPAGTLPHELTHEILSFAGGTTTIKEGLAQFFEMGQYSISGTVRFDMIEQVLKNESYFKDIRGKKKLSLPPLEKFLTLPNKDFMRSNRMSDNYTGALLLFLYFYKTSPDILKNFLDKALNHSYSIMQDSVAIKKCSEAFEILLDGKKEADVEKSITDFYSEYGINLRFR